MEDPAYSAPLLIRAPTVLLFAASGAAVAWAFQAGLGDGTWSISTGIGACMAAAVYEVGRPDRLNPEEAVELESQWQEFGKHAYTLCCPRIYAVMTRYSKIECSQVWNMHSCSFFHCQ